MAWWSFGSGRHAASEPSAPVGAVPAAPAPPEAAVGRGWSELPVLQPTLEPLRPVAPLEPFLTSLASRTDPRFLAPLAHQVDPSTGGLAEGLIRPASAGSWTGGTELSVPTRAERGPAAPRIQRSATRWAPDTAEAGLRRAEVVPDHAPREGVLPGLTLRELSVLNPPPAARESGSEAAATEAGTEPLVVARTSSTADPVALPGPPAGPAEAAPLSGFASAIAALSATASPAGDADPISPAPDAPRSPSDAPAPAQAAGADPARPVVQRTGDSPAAGPFRLSPAPRRESGPAGPGPAVVVPASSAGPAHDLGPGRVDPADPRDSADPVPPPADHGSTGLGPDLGSPAPSVADRPVPTGRGTATAGVDDPAVAVGRAEGAGLPVVSRSSTGSAPWRSPTRTAAPPVTAQTVGLLSVRPLGALGRAAGATPLPYGVAPEPVQRATFGAVEVPAVTRTVADRRVLETVTPARSGVAGTPTAQRTPVPWVDQVATSGPTTQELGGALRRAQGAALRQAQGTEGAQGASLRQAQGAEQGAAAERSAGSAAATPVVLRQRASEPASSGPAEGTSFSEMFGPGPGSSTGALPGADGGVVQRAPAEVPPVEAAPIGDAPLSAPTPGGPATPGAPATTVASATPSGADLEEMARRLYEPLSVRLRAELWLDRERSGLMSDLH